MVGTKQGRDRGDLRSCAFRRDGVANPLEVPKESCGSAGELYDLLEAKSGQLHAVAPHTMSAVEVFHDLALKGRCSALITVTRKLF